MWQRYGKVFLVPALTVVGVTAGAVGGAVAFDQWAARYLWPEAESLVVVQASPDRRPVERVSEDYPDNEE
ncbi:MAG: hypothetical protein AAGG38_06640 [Planctomycetota bacterium]